MSPIENVRLKISDRSLKVLIAGPTNTFNVTTDMINNGFRLLDCVKSTKIYDFRQDAQKNGHDEMSNNFIKLSKEYDLIFVYKGDFNTKDLNKKLCNNSILFLWYMDWFYNLNLQFNIKKNNTSSDHVKNNILESSKYYHYRSATSFQTSREWSKRISMPVFHVLDGSDPYFYYPQNCSKKYDVTFVGYTTSKPMDNERRSSFDVLRNNKINVRFFPNPEEPEAKNRTEVNNIYNESKIVLNISRGNEEGYSSVRLWNILMSGSFVLSKDIKGLDRLGLKNGKHIVTYSNEKDLLNKCRYYLEHENERKEIARNGHMIALSNRTWKHTTNEIINLILEKEPNIIV